MSEPRFFAVVVGDAGRDRMDLESALDRAGGLVVGCRTAWEAAGHCLCGPDLVLCADTVPGPGWPEVMKMVRLMNHRIPAYLVADAADEGRVREFGGRGILSRSRIFDDLPRVLVGEGFERRSAAPGPARRGEAAPGTGPAAERRCAGGSPV